MATTDLSGSTPPREVRTAKKGGLGVAALGTVVFNVAPLLNRVHLENTGTDRTG